MRILFIILMIIGILLLILLLFAALCLFYPVSYRVKARFWENACCQARFWWLFHLLRLEISYGQDGRKICLHILWFTKTFGETAEEQEQGHSTVPAKSFGETGGKGHSAKGGEFDVGQEETASLQEDSPKEIKALQKAEDEESESMPRAESLQEAVDKNDIVLQGDRHKKEVASRKREKKEKNVSRKKKHKKAVYRGKKAGNEHKPSKLSNMKKKKEDWKNKYEQLRAEITDEKNKAALKHMWKELRYLLTHIKPKHADGAIDFSAADPAATGQITGILSLFPLFYYGDMRICPDFESEEIYIRGNISFDGRMFSYHALICLIRVIRDHNIMRIIQKFR